MKIPHLFWRFPLMKMSKYNSILWKRLCLLRRLETHQTRYMQAFPKRQVLFWRQNHPISCQILPLSCSKQKGGGFLSIENSATSPLFWSQAASIGMMSQVIDKKNNLSLFHRLKGWKDHGTADNKKVIETTFTTKRVTSSILFVYYYRLYTSAYS